MKYILLTILLFNSAQAQDDYVVHWVTVAKEVGVVNYQIQNSKNNITWTTIATISPKRGIDSNRYQYTIPSADSYIRVKALMSKNTIYTAPIKVVNSNVAISNAILKYNYYSDNVKFTASNEAAVDYYSIERNKSGSTKWDTVGKLMQTNKRNYTVNIYKSGTNRKYRLIAVYKNGIRSEYINFQFDD